MFDAVKWMSLGGASAPVFRYAPTDADARLVAAIHPLIRARVERAANEICALEADMTLSTIGRAMRAETLARDALEDVNDMSAMEASRKALQARLDAAPVPSLDSIPTPLVAPLIAALSAIDPAMRAPQAREWLLENGDTNAAVVLVNLPAPLALVTDAERDELRETLRVNLNAPASRRAADLSQVIEAVDREAKAGRLYLASYLPTAAPQPVFVEA